MAVDEAGKASTGQADTGAAGPGRRGRRPATTIELAATDVVTDRSVDVGAAAAAAVSDAIKATPEMSDGNRQAAPEPAQPAASAPEPPRAAAPAPAPASKPSRMGGIVTGAVTGILGGIAASITVAPFLRPAVPDPAPRIAAIEAAQGQLAKGATVTELAGEVARLRAAIDALKGDLGRQVESQGATLGTRLAGLDAAAKQLGERLDGLSVPVAGGGAALDIGPLVRRVEELGGVQTAAGQKLADVEQAARGAAEAAREAGQKAVAALGRLDSAEAGLKAAEAAAAAAAEGAKEALSSAAALPQRLAPELTALGGRLEDLTRRQDAAAAAPILAAVQALAAAVRRGEGFAVELSALDALRVPAEKTADLRPLAEKGAPTPAALLQAFQPLASTLAASGEPASGIASVMSRFVSIRPVGEPAGNQPPALVARIETALRRGDTALALADWGLLPDAAKRASAAFAESLSQRDRAAKALAALEKDAIDQLRKSGS